MRGLAIPAAICSLILTPGASRGQTVHPHPDTTAAGWRMPPSLISMPMLPGLAGLTPAVDPFLPGSGVDPASVPAATPRELITLSDGDTLELTAMLVRRTIGDRTLLMYGFNGQYPGPLMQVEPDATIYVRFRNRIELPSTVHWHGVRLDNRFDGVPEVTQDPVPPGGTFLYRVHLPDAGLYWYHPHVRTDIEQDLGLYGNILVRSPDPDYFGPSNADEVLMLDDLLLDERGLFPWGRERAIHTLMGRFGNVMLVNGEPIYHLNVAKGAVVRFFLTDVSNTRTFNLSFGDAPMKLLGADVGRFERQQRVGSVAIAPAQRYIVDVRFPQAGTYALVNRIQAIDHFRGEFVPRADTLGTVTVSEEPAQPDLAAEFERNRSYSQVTQEIERYRRYFDRPLDHRLVLTTRAGDLPRTIVQLATLDTLYKPPVEFNDEMPMMNYLSSGRNVVWILRDPDTGRENMNIAWRFKQGDVVKLRISNDPKSFHPMQHPIHIHGQRFLVLDRDGVANENLAWKDTVLVPVGSYVDILLDASNPGEWLAHCHISEHIEAGMKTVISVEPAGEAVGSAGKSSIHFRGGNP